MVQLWLSPAQAAISSFWRDGVVSKEPEEAAGTIPGLANLGNTCFMNAVLQCLLNTPAWLAEACRSFNTLELRDNSELSGKAVLGRGFAQLVAEYNATDGKPLARSNPALKNLKAAIATLDPQYAGCQQQDAYEFLGCLLEGLEENFHSLFQGLSASGRGPQASVVRAVCGVTSHTSRTCHACSGCFRVDEVTDTALRVPLISPAAQMDQAKREEEERQPTSLAELLEAVRQPEEIGGYDCDRCRKRDAGGAAERSTVTQHAGIITATRDVLVVVLYRFCHGLDSAGRFKPMKVRRQVACPTVLNMETGEYRLFGVVSHVGTSLSAGHYIAAVKSLRDDMWYECDDERVRPLNLTALYGGRSVSAVREGADPYILFYHLKKVDPPAELPTATEDAPAAEPTKLEDAPATALIAAAGEECRHAMDVGAALAETPAAGALANAEEDAPEADPSAPADEALPAAPDAGAQEAEAPAGQAQALKETEERDEAMSEELAGASASADAAVPAGDLPEASGEICTGAGADAEGGEPMATPEEPADSSASADTTAPVENPLVGADEAPGDAAAAPEGNDSMAKPEDTDDAPASTDEPAPAGDSSLAAAEACIVEAGTNPREDEPMASSGNSESREERPHEEAKEVDGAVPDCEPPTEQLPEASDDILDQWILVKSEGDWPAPARGGDAVGLTGQLAVLEANGSTAYRTVAGSASDRPQAAATGEDELSPASSAGKRDEPCLISGDELQVAKRARHRMRMSDEMQL